ncbi:unnamed protein product [Peronospora belbahrii]|uniref:Uncharacterized protein n=1 Tax=Peronospora belbahrii TaxID=622444 RepID=A0ABN8CNZ4_9STRA|nr:unnamed protein product [Peronospora belbahrii]
MHFASSTSSREKWGHEKHAADDQGLRGSVSMSAIYDGLFWQGIDPTDTINFSEHSKALIRIAQDAKKLEKRVTLKQLVDEFKSRKFAQDWKMLDPAVASMSRRICDSIVINLLLSDVLQPDISYTAFNTICYLTPGPRAQYLKKDRLQIHLPRCLMDASEGPDDTFFEAPKKRKRSPDIITIE